MKKASLVCREVSSDILLNRRKPEQQRFEATRIQRVQENIARCPSGLKVNTGSDEAVQPENIAFRKNVVQCFAGRLLVDQFNRSLLNHPKESAGFPPLLINVLFGFVKLHAPTPGEIEQVLFRQIVKGRIAL